MKSNEAMKGRKPKVPNYFKSMVKATTSGKAGEKGGTRESATKFLVNSSKDWADQNKKMSDAAKRYNKGKSLKTQVSVNKQRIGMLKEANSSMDKAIYAQKAINKMTPKQRKTKMK